MRPWFMKEGDVVPFPKKDDKVIKLPNVGSYPNFLAGVEDLQSHVKKGELSDEMYKRLYTELLHRFMRRESAETPWFINEAARGVMYREPGQKFYFKNDKNKFIEFQKVYAFPQKQNNFENKEQMEQAIQTVFKQMNIKDIHWFNNPVGSLAFAIAHFKNEQGQDKFFGKYFRQLTGSTQQRTNLWKNTDFRDLGYQLDTPSSRKAGYGLKPQLIGIKTDTAYTNPNQIISDINDETFSEPLKAMPKAFPKFNVDKTLEPAIRDDFGEVIGPIAIWQGMNLGTAVEDARKFYLGNQPWSSCKILFPGAQTEGLIDSVLRPKQGAAIGISSKGGKGAKPSVKNIMSGINTARKNPTENNKKLLADYQQAIAVVEFLSEQSAVDGVIKLAYQRGIIERQVVDAFEKVIKNNKFTRQDQQILLPLTKYKKTKGESVLLWHALAGLANLLAQNLNNDKKLKLSEACLKFINSSPLIQLYMNTRTMSDSVEVKGFTAIWPPQFAGQIEVTDRMYQTNKSPNGRMSFSFV